MFQQAADATVRIENGPSSGSGFHCIRSEIIVTNRHVIVDPYAAITAVTENGARLTLQIVSESPANQHDYAILRSTSAAPAGRTVLRPKVLALIQRGKEVIFSGFPHGIAHLLVQRA